MVDRTCSPNYACVSHCTCVATATFLPCLWWVEAWRAQRAKSRREARGGGRYFPSSWKCSISQVPTSQHTDMNDSHAADPITLGTRTSCRYIGTQEQHSAAFNYSFTIGCINNSASGRVSYVLRSCRGQHVSSPWSMWCGVEVICCSTSACWVSAASNPFANYKIRYRIQDLITDVYRWG